NIGGCYLTNDRNQPMMYMIPKGDVLTRIQQRQHVLFYADGKPGRGTFHLNFTLDSASVNTIYLFNADGKSMIDSVVVPVLPADVSWGSLIDGDSNWSMMQRVTPSTNNKTLDSNEKIEKFSQEDPDGVGMSLSAVSVVFAVLLLLAVFFIGLANVIKRASNSGKKSQATVKPTAVDPNEVPGEVMAAISMALYEMSNDAHDIENTVLTIARTRRSYSPWSSKIYGLREIPNKK
ncbi:MAG: OadG family protein, partial [Bacteroidales bacterium]|nr:OadG family protein [Bacteroidales bacterium]